MPSRYRGDKGKKSKLLDPFNLPKLRAGARSATKSKENEAAGRSSTRAKDSKPPGWLQEQYNGKTKK